MPRKQFHEELKGLNKMVAKMDKDIEETIDMLISAIENLDKDLAYSIIGRDDLIDRQEMNLENACITLITMQQPVARDMREITSILKMVTDLERIADQCVDICHYISKMDEGDKPNELDIVVKLVKHVKVMFSDMSKAYIEKDSKLAIETAKSDDVADKYFSDLSNSLVDKADKSGRKNTVYLILIGKYLERMADHITNVCEWINFRLTGEYVQFN